MSDTCLVTKLQGTVTGNNLVKFGTLKLLISRKYLTLSDEYTRLQIRYTGVTSGDAPTFKLNIPFMFNNVEYDAGSEVTLTPTGIGYNDIYIKISNIPADGTYAYISNKYNIRNIGGYGVRICCIMSAKEISYLSSIDFLGALAIEGGSIADLDCPTLRNIVYPKDVTGTLADYPYPENITNISTQGTTFAVVKNDLMGFENLTSFTCYGSTNVVLNTSDMISLFSTLASFNTMDARNTGVSCDADTLAEGLKSAGVVSREITITLSAVQWGGTGTISTTKVFTFDENGDYVIS